MSSPFEPGTKRGSPEETIQAIERATRWVSRINTRDLDDDMDIEPFVEQLREQKEKLRRDYRIKTTEVSVDNFVFNNEERVIDILAGDLDTRVAALRELEDYIDDDFGYEEPLSLSMEELVWLVARETLSHLNSPYGVDRYSEAFTADELREKGQRPSEWEDESFPMHNE